MTGGDDNDDDDKVGSCVTETGEKDGDEAGFSVPAAAIFEGDSVAETNGASVTVLVSCDG